MCFASTITKRCLFYFKDCAWHHRRWIIDRFNVDYQHELALCREFLRQDQRNFHCWNYRRFVVDAFGVKPEDELQFSADKIIENFSNYSAFHHRSLFLKRAGRIARDSLKDELQIVENAIFTEPDDQSAWWYHQFLLRWAAEELAKKGLEQGPNAAADAAEFAEWFTGILQQQLELVRGLFELEENCTWVITCLLNIIDSLLAPALTSNVAREEATALLAERTQLLERLLEVDPNHSQRYRFLLLQSN